MEFFMLRHYTYDGSGSVDVDDVIPCSTSEKGMDYLSTLEKSYDEYEWETDDFGFKIVIRREGRYGYDYYYLESMIMDEVI